MALSEIARGFNSLSKDQKMQRPSTNAKNFDIPQIACHTIVNESARVVVETVTCMDPVGTLLA